MTTPVRVYKLGGPALEDPGLIAPLAAELRSASARVAVVHGGGRHIERMLRALAIESRFIAGRRETSPAAMEVVEMILSGVVNKSLAAGLTDAGLVRATLVADLGRVGTPEAVDTRLVRALWDAGLVPVVSPVSVGPGGISVNVNADEAAFGLARALGATSLVYLSDVPGVRVGEETMATLDADEAARLIADGTIAGGMALKVQVALDAARGGIEEVVVAGKERLMAGFAGTRIVVRDRAEADAAGTRSARA